MSSFKAGFIPLARINFDMEAAGEYLAAAKKMLHGISPNFICPEKHLSSYEEMTQWIKDNGPFDFVVVQASTFIDPRFCLEYLRLINCPVLLWGVREPSIAAGTRLRLNSMTGMVALSQLMYQLGQGFEYMYGNADEERVTSVVKRWAKAAEVAYKVRNMKMGLIGSIPPGYFFSLEEEVFLRSNLGPQIVHTEVYKLFKEIEEMSVEEKRQTFEQVGGSIAGMRDMPEERQLNFGGFYKAMSNFIDNNKLDAVCGRCWPDSFEGLGIAFCMAYGLKGAELPVGCEADMGGTITMSCLSWLAGSPAYLADPVSLDEENDTLTFWHCGYGAPELANPNFEIRAVGHPNRKLPPVFEFSLKPGYLTIARVGKTDKGYRLLIAGGEAQDAPVQFSGTSAVVKIDGGSEEFLDRLVYQGWEYHIAMVYGDVRDELETLGNLLGIEVIRQ